MMRAQWRARENAGHPASRPACAVPPHGRSPPPASSGRWIRQWRDGWLSGAEGMVPALSLPDGMLTGVPALTWLAELAGRTAAGARLPAAVGR